MKTNLRGSILVISIAILFTGYGINGRAQPAKSIQSPPRGLYTGKTDCIDMEKELRTLKSQESELRTSLLPERLNLARLESLTGLSGAKAAELSSQLLKVRLDKAAVLQIMEKKGCQD